MFTGSSWIDEDLHKKALPKLNLGVGYHVIFAQPAQIPVKLTHFECTLTYSGGLNLLEQFMLKAAVSFQPDPNIFHKVTGIDLDLIQPLYCSLKNRGLLEENGGIAAPITATCKGRKVHKRLSQETEVEKNLVVCGDILTNQLQLFGPNHPFKQYNLEYNELLVGEVEGALGAALDPKVGDLNQGLRDMNPGDPFYGYRLIEAVEIPKKSGIFGRDVGLFLIHDVVHQDVAVRVFDLASELFHPELEPYFNPEEILLTTGLLIQDPKLEDDSEQDDDYTRPHYEEFVQKVTDLRLSPPAGSEAAPSWEFLVDFQIKPRFLEIIKEAKSELLLVAPWVRDYAMGFLIEPFMEAARKGTKIIIVWGIDRELTEEIREENRDWVRRFSSVRQPGGLPSVSFIWAGNHHRKEIIADGRIFVIGSFNWLSYAGCKTRDGRIRGESILVSSEKSLASEARENFIQLVEPALKRDWRYYQRNPAAQMERNVSLAAWLQLGMYDEILAGIESLQQQGHLKPALHAISMVEEVLENYKWNAGESALVEFDWEIAERKAILREMLMG